MPQSAGGAPTAGGGGARSRVTAEAQPIKPSQDGKASNNYGINGANGEHQHPAVSRKAMEVDMDEVAERALRWYQRPMKRRYLMALLAFFGFCIIYMLRVNLSVAIVAMTANKTRIFENGTTIMTGPDFVWASSTQGFILGSFFYGYIFTQIPGGMMATKYGGKRIFLTGIAATSCLTMITPLSTYMGTGFLIGVRFLEGLFEGMTYPSIHAIWAKWAPPLERSRLAAVAFSGSYVGTVIALPLSGVLAEHINWESIFYVFGTLGLVWCATWWWVARDSPEEDRNITDAELEYLRTAIGVSNEESVMAPPWKAMFTSRAVWAIILAHFAENWGFYTLLTGLPMFMRDVLDYRIDKAGFLAAFPYLLMALIVQSAGVLADYARTKGRLTTTQVRKIFTCSSYVCQTVFMTATALFMFRGAAITCISLSLGCGGFAWAGFSINHLDIAPQYAAILMGISNTIGTIPGIISPVITGFIVQDGTHSEWQVVFLITAVVYLCGAIAYGLMASGERQDWSRIEGEDARLSGVDEQTFMSEATTASAASADYGATEKNGK